MKSFLIILSEKQPHLFNENLLDSHIDYLRKIYENGNLAMCGPFADQQGAMLVLRAESENDAIDIIKRDPFIQKQYYKKYAMHEFTKAGKENDWLRE